MTYFQGHSPYVTVVKKKKHEFCNNIFRKKTNYYLKCLLVAQVMRINYIPLSPSVSHAKFESTSFPLNLEILVSEFWPLTRVHNIGETGCCSHLWRWALLAPLGSYNLKIYWQILGFTFPMWRNLFLFFLLSLSWKSTGSVVGWLENSLIYSECLSLHFLAWAK